MVSRYEEKKNIIQYNRIKNMRGMNLPYESNPLPRKVTNKRIELEISRKYRQREKEWEL